MARKAPSIEASQKHPPLRRDIPELAAKKGILSARELWTAADCQEIDISKRSIESAWFRAVGGPKVVRALSVVLGMRPSLLYRETSEEKKAQKKEKVRRRSRR